MVVVRFSDRVDIPYEDDIQLRAAELKLGPWDRLEERYGPLALKRLIAGLEPAQITALQRKAMAIDPTYRPARFTSFFYLEGQADTDLDGVVRELAGWSTVERAYVDIPGPDPAVNADNDPRAVNQGYLDEAPEGIDARYAWTITGGDGAGQRVVDLERGWTLDHEDLVDHGVTLIHGSNRDLSRSHGTSVLGELCAADNAIGCVGIAPNVATVLVTSFHESTRPDAIFAALDQMAFGDVLLIEAQVTANSGDLLLGPIEIYDAEFEALRLATALGIIVVEAGGNGTDNGAAPPMAMDTWEDDSGRRLLSPEPANPDFRDSGAILVSAATSDTPRTRRPFGPHGVRIDCHAWGENIDTCASDELAATEVYRSSFGGTSGASPIVTGAALLIQGICEAVHGFRLNPRQMRDLLRDPALNTASATTETTAIGVMPNLRQIIDALGATPDVYLRDFVGDTGEPHNGPISASPDIILRAEPVADPQIEFGEGSGTENSTTLGSVTVAGQSNFIYVRALNQGGADAIDVQADIYWSEPATLVTPDLWNPIGTAAFPLVPTGEQLTCSEALEWPATEIPGTGHYCFVGILGSAGDPPPAPVDFTDFDKFRSFIRHHNNVTWRNFNVVDSEPDPAVARDVAHAVSCARLAEEAHSHALGD